MTMLKKINLLNNLIAVKSEDSSYHPNEIIKEAADKTIQDHDHHALIGKTFGAWITTELIYTSHKSTIFKGQPSKSSYSQDVAIKITSPTVSALTDQQHAQKQAHYMEQLKHPNMVEIKCADINNNGIHYVVMEYLPGPNISQYCKINFKKVDDIIPIFIELCDGIQHIHKNLAIHADLKPQNILMDIHNKPKIIDLDLSLSTDEKFLDGHKFKNLSGLSKKYASPEQLQKKTASTLSDIYSLGRILLELLADNSQLTNFTEIKSKLDEKYGRSYKHNELTSIIIQCIKTDPLNRYQSVTELILDLTIYQQHTHPVNAFKPNYKPIYLTYKLFHRNKFFIISIASIILILITSLLQINNEKAKAEKALQLLINSNDPRNITDDIQFENNGKILLSKKKLSSENDYNDLMRYGNSYYGKGKTKKAILFFKKAISLYKIKFDEHRINAITKLALAYYSTNRVDDAAILIKPYLYTLLNKKISSPSLIQMLLAVAEINEQYRRNIFGDTKIQTVSNILSKIKLNKIKNTKIRNNLHVAKTLYFNISLYREINSDYISPVIYANKKEYNSYIQPTLHKISNNLEQLLTFIKINNIHTDKESLIYLWLSVIKSDLKDYYLAEKYNDIAIKQTSLLFGLYHPRTLQTYFKRYVIFHYQNPKKALKAALKAFDVSNKIKNTNYSAQLMPYFILSDAYQNFGDIRNTILILNTLDNFYEKNKQKINNNIDTAAVLSSSYLEILAFNFLELPIFKKFSKLSVEHELAFYKYNQEDTDVDGLKLRIDINNFSTKDAFKKIKQQFQKTIHQPWQSQIINTVLVEVLEYCANNSICIKENMNKYLKYYFKNENWGYVYKNKSIEKLRDKIRIANILIKLNKIELANTKLNDIEKLSHSIFTLNENNIYTALWHITKARLLLKTHTPSKEILIAKHAKLALSGIIYNFGVDNHITDELLQYIHGK